jgi:hypothetical protein
VKRGNDPTFHIEQGRVHPHPKLETWISQEGCHPTVPGSFRGIPDHIIARENSLPVLKLLGADFDLLQTQDVWLLLPYPLEGALREPRTQSIDIPSDDLHLYYFIRLLTGPLRVSAGLLRVCTAPLRVW